ncbi:MAG: hypothetical protein HQ555_01885 [Candidatus Aminicenantes bacterium]|nr:hypothetical protein [Candidatus Aminicenantes bacterium]
MITLSKGFKRIFTDRLPVLFFILFFLTFFMVGCGTLELNSDWRDREITVDGRNDDWLGNMMYFEEENVSLGLLNDENFIYICLIAEDQMIRNQVMSQGITLWFDPEGGKKKTFGIKFPIGMQPGERQDRRKHPGGVPNKEKRDEGDLEELRQARMKQMDELEILGPGKEKSVRMPVEKAKGIYINVKLSSGMLVYEIKVPLKRSEEYLYAVGTKAGNLVGIGLETSKIKRPSMGRGMSGGMGGRGGAGGRGGMGGIRGGGMRPQMPKPLKIWAVVQLALE